MSRLLRANFARLWGNIPFYICFVLMAGVGAGIPVSRYREVQKYGTDCFLDDHFFLYAACIGVVGAFFISMFIGTEYSRGTIRNKITSGHSRRAIYFANLITVFTAMLIFCAAFIIPYLCTGIPLLGGFKRTAIPEIVKLCLCSLFTALSYSGIFLAAAMLIQSKADSAAVCIMASYFLLYGGVYINSCMYEQEYYQSYSYSEETGEETAVMLKNPNYPEGLKRQVYQIINDVFPGNQSVRLFIWQSDAVSSVGKMEIYSLMTAAAVSCAGAAVFGKKAIK